MSPYDGRVSGRAVCPLRRGVASSEAEMICPLEGRFAALERGGDARHSQGVSTGALERGGNHPAVRGERGWAAPCRWAACLGFFKSFPFFQIGRRPWAFLGPIALIMCLHFRVILVPD